MDFSFTEEQTMLRDTVAAYLRDRYDIEARRAATASETGWRPEVWSAFATELGILGASIPEESGGLGGGPIETMIVMEEMGRALAIEPFLETVVIGAGLLKRCGAGAAPLLEAVLAGDALLALAHGEPRGGRIPARLETTAHRDGSGWVLNGRKAVVAAAPWATHLLVSARTGGAAEDGVSLFLVEKGAQGLSTQDYATVDGRRASEVRLDDAVLPEGALLGQEGAALPLIEEVLDEATVALCAEALGVMRRLHEDTLDYARQRRQFGRPIGEFQVLQHRMVDMFIALEQSVSLTYMATLKLGEPAPERMKAVSAAKVQIGQACRFIGQNAVQIHGGIGMTDELALSHYFKRATVIEGQFGSVDHHLERYQRLSLAGAARRDRTGVPTRPELLPSRDQ